MKLRNLSITAAAFALAFGLSACGQRDAGAPPAAAASASIAPAASVTLDA
ncbi:cytochrome c5 family protein, partial [Burkholderia pseudomallei]|nr:cytochrome c5 family protein [Burkholderia pseudomallei]